MFEYNIDTENNPQKALQACKVIEKAFPNAKQKPLLEDVDGSTIQTYVIDGKEVDVYDDYWIGAVYVKSEFNLDNLFKPF